MGFQSTWSSICLATNSAKVNLSGFTLYAGTMTVPKKFTSFPLWYGTEASCLLVVFCRSVNKIPAVRSRKWSHFVRDGVGRWILRNRRRVVLWRNWRETVLVVLIGRRWGSGSRLRVTRPLLNRILVTAHVVRDSNIHTHADINTHGRKHVILLGVVSWVLLYRELVWVLLRVGPRMKGTVVIGHCGLAWSGPTPVSEVHCRGYRW